MGEPNPRFRESMYSRRMLDLKNHEHPSHRSAITFFGNRVITYLQQ